LFGAIFQLPVSDSGGQQGEHRGKICKAVACHN